MAEIIIAMIPVMIALIYNLFNTITNHLNNKTRIELYKLSITSGIKHGTITNNRINF